MAKALWKDLGGMMGRFRCITLHEPKKDVRDPVELCLAGERGEIWESGVGTYKAVLFHPTGAGKIYRFNSKDLARWYRRLKVPASRGAQARLANGR